MKPGDKFPVNLREWVVAEAVVIDIEDGKVTLDIPATRVVMGVRTDLTDLEPEAPEKEYAILDDKPQDLRTLEDKPTVAPVQSTIAESKPSIPPDAIGEGLATVQLKEMD